jgi:Transcriptional regulator/sugar kinase
MIFNQDKLYKNVVGVFFGGKKLQVARIENGSVAQMIHKEINNRETEEYILHELILAIETVFNDSIQGIGIGVPSIVDVKSGIVFNATNVPSWRKVYLKDILEERFKTPTYVNNDANCFAMGEKYFGVAKDFQNIAGITIGAGLGVGIIINGRLYSGRNCGAGEFCSIPYRDHDYEYYCSTGYFEEKYGIKSNVLLARARKNDKIALSIYEQFGFDFGNAIKTIIYAIDPEAIVVGGQLSEAYDFFKDAMLKSIKTFLYGNTISNIVILKSEEPNIEAYGAAALCFENDSNAL